MTTFDDDRERAFEAKYARAEEFKFRVAARRDKLFAQWAADRLHLVDTPRDAFVAAVRAVQGYPHHDAALVRHVAEAVAAGGAALDAAQVEDALKQCAETAEEQLMHAPLPAPRISPPK